MLSIPSILAFSLASAVSLCAAHSQWSLEGAKLSIATIDGSSRLTESFSLDQAPSTAKVDSVSADEVLRLAFNIQSSSGEKLKANELPHQVVVTLASPSYTTSSIVTVKASSGKASWNQRIDRLPSALTSNGGDITMKLLIVSFGEAAPVEILLHRFRLADSTSTSKDILTARERQEIRQGFRRHVDRRHTFNVPAADQMPPKMVSLLAAVTILVLPSATLAILLSRILPSLSFRSPSSASAPFLASLFSIEFIALLYWYGNGFTLFKMMPWLLAIGTLSVFLGRTALSEMQRVRLGKQA